MNITIGWLYPHLMSTYGDRGNIFCLKKRMVWRNIDVTVVSIDHAAGESEIRRCDVIIGGGAQDIAQEQVIEDLQSKKRVLKTMFEEGIPGLFVCGSPQLLGQHYTTADGKKLEGLGFFDFYTVHPGSHVSRCIGNTVGEIPETFSLPGHLFRNTIVGFENHGGRTYLGPSARPFAKVIKGYGNNGEDGTEGAVWNNVIACYYHGPLLAKNPHIADWLIYAALKRRYPSPIAFDPLDDTLVWKAHDHMIGRRV